MPPRKAPAVRRPPVVRPNRRSRPAVTPIAEEATDAPVLMSPSQLQLLVAQSIAAALAAYETARNGSSGHSGNLGENHIGNQGGNPGPSQYHPRSCSLKDFLACKPLNFRGTEGVVGLTRWIEKMEAVFHHSNCSADCRVKYATATLMDTALSWWNDHANSIGLDNAYAMDWVSFKGIMVEEYCPRQEIQKLEHELWNHKMQGSDIAAYTARFNDLASLCPGMVTPEYKKTERYIYGLAPAVQFHVMASRPTTFDSAKRLASLIIEESIRQGTMSPPTKDNKRISHGPSWEDNKRQRSNSEPTAVYAAITNPEPTAVYAATANPSTNTSTNPLAPSKNYDGTAPPCAQCKFHHRGNCMLCENCNRRGHTARFCRGGPAPTSVATRAPASANANPAAGDVRTCYECNLPGHFRRECPKLKNQGGPGRAFFIGTRDA